MCILLNFRAQDKAAMQLSELEEEMDQRIQAAEHKTRKDVSVWFSFMQWLLLEPLSRTGLLGAASPGSQQRLSIRAFWVVVVSEGKEQDQ